MTGRYLFNSRASSIFRTRGGDKAQVPKSVDRKALLTPQKMVSAVGIEPTTL